MMITRSAVAAAIVFAGVVSVHAQDAKPVTAAPATAKADAWVGLAVTSSDGALLGKVTSLKASADGKGQILYVTSPTDGKIFAIPSELAAQGPAGLEVKATASDLRKTAK